MILQSLACRILAALRKGAPLWLPTLRTRATLRNVAKKDGHPPLREKNLSIEKQKDQEGFFAQTRRSDDSFPLFFPTSFSRNIDGQITQALAAESSKFVAGGGCPAFEWS